MSKIKVVIMGLLKKLGVRNIFSVKNLNISNSDPDQDNEEIKNRQFRVEMDKYLSLRDIYFIGECIENAMFKSTIPQCDIILDQNRVLKKKKINKPKTCKEDINFELLLNQDAYFEESYDELIKFNYGEYIRIMMYRNTYSVKPRYIFSVLSWDSKDDLLMFGINEVCKIKIDEYYDEYNRLLHDKIVTFSKNTKELQELAHNAVALCAEYTLLDLESIKFLYYEHTCFYKSEDFGDIENIKEYIGIDSVRIMDNLIQNMAEILEEEIDEPEATLGHAAFEAFMRAYIEHFASEYDKYIINEFGKNDISFKADDYCQYIKNLVEISDFDYDDKFIIALVCKLTSLGLLEGYDTIIDAYEAVVDEIEEAEKNKSSNLIKDMLRGRKAIDRKKYTIDEIDLMDGYMFEEFLSKLFEKMGYSAEVTKKTNDQGIDIVGKKNGRKVGIQAKCYSNNVGNSAIQEAVAGKSFYDCDAVMVVTNSYFTESAKKLARANDVILWDRNMLAKKIDEFL